MKCKMCGTIARLGSVLILGMSVSSASAAITKTYFFEALPTTWTADGAVGEMYLQLEATYDDNNGTAEFLFKNLSQATVKTSPDYFVLDAVYFFDGLVINGATGMINNAPEGVAFDTPATPGHLPGISWATNYYFTADANNPQPKNGVGPGEELSIRFLMATEPLTDLITALDDGLLWVGAHAQAFADGGSVSFIHDAPNVGSAVPEPTALLVWSILGGGAAGVASLRRRRGWSDKNRQAIREVFRG